MGHGDSGTDSHTFRLRENQNVDVGILKLFLSKERVDVSDVAQPSPFDTPSPQVTSPIIARYTGEAKVEVLTGVKLPVRHFWDTKLVPVVQRRANN